MRWPLGSPLLRNIRRTPVSKMLIPLVVINDVIAIAVILSVMRVIRRIQITVPKFGRTVMRR